MSAPKIVELDLVAGVALEVAGGCRGRPAALQQDLAEGNEGLNVALGSDRGNRYAFAHANLTRPGWQASGPPARPLVAGGDLRSTGGRILPEGCAAPSTRALRPQGVPASR